MKLFFQHYYNEIRSRASGGVQPNLNLGIIKSTTIPIPPLEEQDRIIERVERYLSVSEEIEQEIERELMRAERLRQSILKQAFEGKLVPQDLSDEPAEKLLERIQEERSKLKAVDKKNKRKKPTKK